jgi:hypothetical protein
MLTPTPTTSRRDWPHNLSDHRLLRRNRWQRLHFQVEPHVPELDPVSSHRTHAHSSLSLRPCSFHTTLTTPTQLGGTLSVATVLASGPGSGDVALIVSDRTNLTVGGTLGVGAGIDMGGGDDDDKRQTQPDVGKDGGSASLEVLSSSSVIVRGAHSPPLSVCFS